MSKTSVHISRIRFATPIVGRCAPQVTLARNAAAFLTVACRYPPPGYRSIPAPARALEWVPGPALTRQAGRTQPRRLVAPPPALARRTESDRLGFLGHHRPGAAGRAGLPAPGSTHDLSGQALFVGSVPAGPVCQDRRGFDGPGPLLINGVTLRMLATEFHRLVQGLPLVVNHDVQVPAPDMLLRGGTALVVVYLRFQDVQQAGRILPGV